MDRVAVKESFASIDHRIVTVNPHRAVVVRDREGKDLPMKLLLALYSSTELDDAPYSNSHAVSVLSISDVKRCSTALYFAREEREVHSVGCDEEGGIIDGANERIEPTQLLVRERGPPKSKAVIRLRPWALHRNTTCPAFINIFDQIVEMPSTIYI